MFFNDILKFKILVILKKENKNYYKNCELFFLILYIYMEKMKINL